MKRFAIRTLGCKVNQYETEAMEELFLRNGYQRVEDREVCDVYVINTCTVTSLSDAKCRQQIHRVRRLNPEAVIAVVGCYSQVAPEEIEKIEGVDLILGTKGRARIVELVEECAASGRQINAVTDLDEDRSYDELPINTELSMTRAYIKIQEGCDMFCTYCIIPYARGHIASRPLHSIREEAERLSDGGFREVVLTGIHVASYGKENGGKEGLIDAIETVASVEGIERIRLSSLEPRWVRREFLERMKQTGKICDHFHLSLQSGSDPVLKLMNRKYDKDTYREKIALIREVFPDAGITTDVIVGFPGETRREFEETVRFCEEIGFSRIHIFPYSPRKGTPAADYEETADGAEKKRRARELAEVEERLRLGFLRSHIGTEAEVLFEEFSGDGMTMAGYTSNYMRVECPRDFDAINRVRRVRLNALAGEVLQGELVSDAAEQTR